MLDSLDAYAAKKKLTLIVDEFQKMVEFGAEEAEWQLRSAIQQHQHLNHIYAGSQETIARFGLPSSSKLAYHFNVLVKSDVLEKGPEGYRFDNPFFKHWVAQTLPEAL